MAAPLEKLEAAVRKLATDIAELRDGQAELRDGQAELREGVTELREDVTQLQGTQGEILTAVKGIQRTQTALTNAMTSAIKELATSRSMELRV